MYIICSYSSNTNLFQIQDQQAEQNRVINEKKLKYAKEAAELFFQQKQLEKELKVQAVEQRKQELDQMRKTAIQGLKKKAMQKDAKIQKAKKKSDEIHNEKVSSIIEKREKFEKRLTMFEEKRKQEELVKR
jgi:hypothetical protein